MTQTRGGTAQPGFVPARGAAAQQASAPESEEQSVTPSRALWLLITIVAVTGLALAIRGAFGIAGNINWQVLIVLTALAVIAERSDLSLYGNSRVSLAFVPIFAALILGGLAGLAIVVPAAAMSSAFGKPLYKTAFNFGALMLAGAAATLFSPMLGTDSHAYNWPAVLSLTMLAGAINFTTNSLLVATAIAISNRTKVKLVWSEHFLWLWPHYLVLALLGLAMAAGYQAMGIWGIAVFTAPPIMMQLSIKQYLDRTTTGVLELRDAHGKLQTTHEELTGAMDSLGNAYEGTLRSLVAALDARDSETAGHSERVADLTMAIGAEMGIPNDTEEWRHVSWGALLHDVGKIAIPDGILRKPSRLTEGEWETMRTHPRAGYDILRQVDFLAPAADIVLAHHERYDGKGYPRGLVADQIPLGARIFMIADAFDAMTSDRSYRSAMPAEEALAEILRNCGTQFDPAAVIGFLSVYRKRFVGAGQQRSAGAHSHHDEPKLSEALETAIREAIETERA